MQTSPTSASWDPPQQLPPPTIPAVPRRRRRWPLWTGLGVGLLVVGGLVVGGLAVLDHTALRHDLITTDFDVSAEPFLTGTTPEYVASLQDGTYSMASTVVPAGRALSFAMFTRTAYAVVIDADVVLLHDPTGDAVFGVACLDLPQSNGHGYAFVADHTGASLVRLDTDGAVLTSAHTTTSADLVGHRMGVTCTKDGDSVLVTGTVDGVEVLSTVDAAGFTRYQAGAMLFMPSDPGDEVRFDDFVARVPGE